MAWCVSEKAPEMSACDAMTVAAVERTTSAIVQRPGGPSRRTGSPSSLGSDEHERALAEVVEDERRHDEREPREADGPRAEVAHVGVERLAAGDGEDDGAEHERAAGPVRSRRTPAA